MVWREEGPKRAEEVLKEMTAARGSRPVSRYALSDLAIRSAMALERFAFGEPLDHALVAKFATALSDTSSAESMGQARYFAVGYHSPYMKLAGTRGVSQSVDEVQSLLDEKAKSITSFLAHPNKTAVSELAEFCADLHHELAQSQLAEMRLAKRHRNRSEAKRLPSRLRPKADTSAS